MQKIIPHLWYDKQAKEAAELYTSLLPNSKITNSVTLHNTPSGDCDVVTFDLAGYTFMAIDGGPLFKFTPAVSFHIKCKTVEEVDRLWEKLSKDGTVLMELGEYPFSKRYGWLQDKYGLSWQIIHAGDQPFTQAIVPVIMFVGPAAGKTEEALKLYTSTFSGRNDLPPSRFDVRMRYGKGEEPDKEGTIKYASFILAGQEFGAMDSAHDHKFGFSEAISFIIGVDTQEELDYFWEKLSADPKAEVCGWLKDKFGVSWQVSPKIIEEVMRSGDQEKIDKITQAFLPMKKLDIAKLKASYEK